MSRGRRLLRRGVFSVVGAYVVVSAAFLLSRLTPQGATYAQGPLLDRYVAWLVNLTTLEWGYSAVGKAPVFEAIATALPNTLGYMLPAVFFAVVVGVLVGTWTALNPDGLLDKSVPPLAYAGYALPNFVAGSLLVLVFAVDPIMGMPSYDDGPIQHVLWPAAVLTTTLLATQFRYARAQSREYAATDFVKLVRAKGGGVRNVARHVVRNAALPLVSLFFVEAFAVLVVNVVVVESVFAIDGIGRLLLLGLWNHDVPTVLGTTVLFVVIGFGGNFLQDAAYTMLDPRVGSD